MTDIRKIAFGKPWIGDEEKQAVLEVLQGDVLTHGPQSKAFEEEFARFCGDGVTAGDLRDIKDRIASYLLEVVAAFRSYIDRYEYLTPARRPAAGST